MFGVEGRRVSCRSEAPLRHRAISFHNGLQEPRVATAEIPIRTLRHISLHPNFAGAPLVVSLGCEKLQPARMFPDGANGVASQEPMRDHRAQKIHHHVGGLRG